MKIIEIIYCGSSGEGWGLWGGWNVMRERENDERERDDGVKMWEMKGEKMRNE